MTPESHNLIPLEECVDRGVYYLRSRNLTLGVFKADSKGFIGIRTKFDSRYLFMEYHHDIGPPLGTARPYKFIEVLDDPRIPLKEHWDARFCGYCGARVSEWDKELEGYRHLEVFDLDCKDGRLQLVGMGNLLFGELDNYREDPDYA